jgi:hypothetical protein
MLHVPHELPIDKIAEITGATDIERLSISLDRLVRLFWFEDSRDTADGGPHAGAGSRKIAGAAKRLLDVLEHASDEAKESIRGRMYPQRYRPPPGAGLQPIESLILSLADAASRPRERHSWPYNRKYFVQKLIEAIEESGGKRTSNERLTMVIECLRPHLPARLSPSFETVKRRRGSKQQVSSAK